MSSTTRRDFLSTLAAGFATTSVAGGLAAATPASPQPSDADSIPIIDAHQHLWDLSKFKLPWLSDVPKLNRSFVMADYLEATKGLNVVKAVYMEVHVHPSQLVQEAEYVIDICRKGGTPTVAAVISGRPGQADFKDYISRFKGSPYVKGVRQVLHTPETPAGFCLDPQFVGSVRLLGELGMSYDLVMRSGELADGAKLASLCPDTRFILDHCGNGDVQAKDRSAWKRGLEQVAAQKNVICKISGIVASAKPDAWTADDLAPIVEETIAQFGINRVIFAGDWPVCLMAATFRQWVEALRQIVRGRSLEDQRKLFHDNAAAFSGL